MAVSVDDPERQLYAGFNRRRPCRRFRGPPSDNNRKAGVQTAQSRAIACGYSGLQKRRQDGEEGENNYELAQAEACSCASSLCWQERNLHKGRVKCVRPTRENSIGGGFTPTPREADAEKKMPTITRMFTMQEASRHSSRDDCWIVIDGKVYDVSSYLDEHPGGDDVVLDATGKDATDEFEDAGHSKEARELLETFCIGELDESSTAIPEMEILSKKQAPDYARKLVDLSKQYWAVPVAVFGISVVVSFLVLRKK
ncbi:hypothetical protein SAY87_013890 [Trapa incisa]|uniref:Cytochrome b5 heme-binding domain-containing protein n=1 Tax=Trapa incisa TaxID=236973 RepID=A0AAN7KJH6_9MYRT|nr:hypothetical protein SAY87_013890 [Trapa incisa]